MPGAVSADLSLVSCAYNVKESLCLFMVHFEIPSPERLG